MFESFRFLAKFVRPHRATPCVLCGGRAAGTPTFYHDNTAQPAADKTQLSLSPLFCGACEQSLPFLSANGCPQCAIEDTGGYLCGVCIAHEPKFDTTIAAFRYQFPVSRLVQDFKFNANFALLELFANALADRIFSSGTSPNVIIPVPLSRQRIATRGFNQSALLADAVVTKLNEKLAKQSAIRVEANWLTKQRDTPAQSGLSPDARRRNIRDAFGLSAAATAAISAQPDLKIALLDDVITTGATLSEAARILKQAGATRVVALVVARVPPPKAKLQGQQHGNLVG